MSLKINQKLLEALNQLETAVKQAKATIEKAANPNAELVERLTCYEQVVTKQKLLASQLLRSLAADNWDEVRRHGELIRQSSFLIEFDTAALLAELSGIARSGEDFNA